ncbi:hypothetical protein HZC27_00765 [Candidatus Roizmanbacteria bacterium]|nr:hypothetical protein [Candidatus Roizmanbacteria bacterium]
MQDFGIPVAKNLVLNTGNFSYTVKLQKGLVAKANKEGLLVDVNASERFKQQTRELAVHAIQVGQGFAAEESDPGLSDKWHKKATLAASRIYMANGQYNLARTTSAECQAQDISLRTQVQKKVLGELVMVVPPDLLPHYFDKVRTLAADDDSLKLYFALALMRREDAADGKSMSRKNARALLGETMILKDEKLISQINSIYGSVEYYIETLRKNRRRPGAQFLTHALIGGGTASVDNGKFNSEASLLKEAFRMMWPHEGVVEVIMQGTDVEFKKQCIARVVSIIAMQGRIQIETDELEASDDNIYLNEILGRVDVQNLWGGSEKCFDDKVYVALLSLANRNSRVKREGTIYKHDPERASRIAKSKSPRWQSTPRGD